LAIAEPGGGVRDSVRDKVATVLFSGVLIGFIQCSQKQNALVSGGRGLRGFETSGGDGS